MLLTAEVWAISQAGRDGAVVGDNVDKAFLDEEHLCSRCAFLDDQVARQVHLELQLPDYIRHEARISVGEERDGRNERPAVEIHDFLNTEHNQKGMCIAIIARRCTTVQQFQEYNVEISTL